MKVRVKQQPEEFKPVTLEITLESREELEAMYQLSNNAIAFYKELCIESLQIADNITKPVYLQLKPLRK